MRKKLTSTGVDLINRRDDKQTALKKKIRAMRERGLSYQTIAIFFNLWKIATRTGNGQWHSKTVREVERNSWQINDH